MKMKVTSIDITKTASDPGEQDVVTVRMHMPGADPRTSTVVTVRTSNVQLLERIGHWGTVFDVMFEAEQ